MRTERSPELRLTPVSSIGRARLTEREHGVRKDEAEPLAVADGREEAGAGRERSSERRRRWRAAERLLLRASEREGDSASRGTRLAAGTETDAARIS